MLWLNDFENKNIKINQQTFWYNIKKIKFENFKFLFFRFYFQN